MTRSEALLAKLSLYNTGKPCKYGHLSDRYTSSKHCVQCKLIQAKTWENENPSKKASIKKQYRTRNKAQIAAQDKQYRVLNKDKLTFSSRLWNVNNRDKCRLYATQSRVKRFQRIPAWLTNKDHKLIQEVYRKARMLTELTGVKYHVDHVIPLRGKLVSGLHVPSNLQILQADVNMKKSNVFC